MGLCCVSAEVVLLCVYGICSKLHMGTLWESASLAASASSLVTGQCNVGMEADAISISLLLICLPGCILKQYINVHQLVTSAQHIAQLDQKAD